MTVGEMIAELKKFDASLTVYVPGVDGRAEIAAVVSVMPHLNVPYGVSIPADVSIMSQEFADELDRGDE